MVETTLMLIKPNAVLNRHIGEIISIIENDGFVIKDLKYFKFNDDLIKNFYHEHMDKSFFPSLKKFMCSGMTLALILERENAVSRLRKLNGDTNPDKQEAGTIRALYADSYTENAVHGSDSITSAQREIKVIFG